MLFQWYYSKERERGAVCVQNPDLVLVLAVADAWGAVCVHGHAAWVGAKHTVHCTMALSTTVPDTPSSKPSACTHALLHTKTKSKLQSLSYCSVRTHTGRFA